MFFVNKMFYFYNIFIIICFIFETYKYKYYLLEINDTFKKNKLCSHYFRNDRIYFRNIFFAGSKFCLLG